MVEDGNDGSPRLHYQEELIETPYRFRVSRGENGYADGGRSNHAFCLRFREAVRIEHLRIVQEDYQSEAYKSAVKISSECPSGIGTGAVNEDIARVRCRGGGGR